MLSRTTMGYEIKACGMNRYAARYAGIADRKTIVMTMAIGILIGLLAAILVVLIVIAARKKK